MASSSVIAANASRVREQIAEAARRAGRRPQEITLVGVTKYVDVAATRMLFEAGCQDLGESRPQSLWEKAEALAGLPVRWHLIGHLQRNKVKRTLPYVSLLHSGDSLRLLQAVDAEAALLDRIVNVLLEVNISGEAAKHGFSADELRSSLPRIAGLAHLRVRGLMTMASLTGGDEQARRDFDALRQLRDSLAGECPAGVDLNELSMGMSSDFEEAILAGATLVRIGSALWDEIS